MSSNPICLPQTRSLALCCAALGFGACEAALTYEARVGVNWSLLILGFAAAPFIASWLNAEQPRAQRPLLALSLLLAAALLVTSDPVWQFRIIAAAVSTLGVQGLALLGARTESVGAMALMSAPFKSLFGVSRACARHTEGLFAQFRAEAALRAVRALLLALPVALVLALVLSGADTTLAAWRDAAIKALLQISILARLAWLGLLSGLMLGALGLSLEPQSTRVDRASLPPAVQFNLTDQLSVLGSAAAVLALYLALQVSHLFGNAAAVVGSHISYADSVHRGFVELNAAATLATLVVVALLSRSTVAPLPAPSRVLALILILQSQLLAVSAIYRVGLYAMAYGYTEQRLLVAVYAGGVILVLSLLGWEVIGAADFRRVARRSWGIGILTLCALVFWNHEAWIVRANLARYQRTGRLDSHYLIWSLGPDGLPELAHRLPGLDPALRDRLAHCLQAVRDSRYGVGDPSPWYEWTLRRSELRQTLAENDRSLGAHAQAPAARRCAPPA